MAEKYITRVGQLYAAPIFDVLTSIRSLRLHPLRGTREGQYAINLTGQWRLIITRGPAPYEVTVEEVSNHYDD